MNQVVPVLVFVGLLLVVAIILIVAVALLTSNKSNDKSTYQVNITSRDRSEERWSDLHTSVDENRAFIENNEVVKEWEEVTLYQDGEVLNHFWQRTPPEHWDDYDPNTDYYEDSPWQE